MNGGKEPFGRMYPDADLPESRVRFLAAICRGGTWVCLKNHLL